MLANNTWKIKNDIEKSLIVKWYMIKKHKFIKEMKNVVVYALKENFRPECQYITCIKVSTFK